MPDSIPPINAEWLARMRATKPELLRTLFTMYLDDEPKRFAALAEAVAKGDMETARYHAHSLKGAAATMGLERLRDACRALEHAVKDGLGEPMQMYLDSIDREAEAVYEIMRRDMPEA